MPGGGLARMRVGHVKFRTVSGKSAHKDRGLADFLFLFHFQTNNFSALETNGTWFASLLKAKSS